MSIDKGFFNNKKYIKLSNGSILLNPLFNNSNNAHNIKFDNHISLFVISNIHQSIFEVKQVEMLLNEKILNYIKEFVENSKKLNPESSKNDLTKLKDFQKEVIEKITFIKPDFFRKYNYTFDLGKAVTSLDFFIDNKIDFYEELMTSGFFSYWLYEYLKANTLEQFYLTLEKDKHVKSYSHFKIGWNSYEFRIDDVFRIRVDSNFGYGKSSYFTMTFYYKDIPIILGNYIIYYLNIEALEKLNFTQKYELVISSWQTCFKFVSNIINQHHAKGSSDFIKERILSSVERWKNDLDYIIHHDKFNLFEKLNELNAFISFSSSHLFKYNDFDENTKKKFQDSVLYHPKDYELYEFRNIRLSLSLKQLDNITALKDLFSTDLEEEKVSNVIKHFKVLAQEMINQNSKFILLIQNKKVPLQDQLKKLKEKKKAFDDELFNKYSSCIFDYKKTLYELGLVIKKYYGLDLIEPVAVPGWDSKYQKPTNKLVLKYVEIPLSDDKWQTIFLDLMKTRHLMNEYTIFKELLFFIDYFVIEDIKKYKWLFEILGAKLRPFKKAYVEDPNNPGNFIPNPNLNSPTEPDGYVPLTYTFREETTKLFSLYKDYMKHCFEKTFKDFIDFRDFTIEYFSNINKTFLQSSYIKKDTLNPLVPLLFDYFLNYSMDKNKSKIWLIEKEIQAFEEQINKIDFQINKLNEWIREYESQI